MSPKEPSKRALREIYYIIIGLAITSAFTTCFVQSGIIIDYPNLIFNYTSTFLLLIAFFITICRFVHASSLHFEKESDIWFKRGLDIIGFLLQASVFFLIAISLNSYDVFINSFVTLLIVDSVWLILLRLGKIVKKFSLKRNKEEPEFLWLINNIILITIIVIIEMTSRLHNLNNFLIKSFIVMSLSIIATITDYWLNRDYYNINYS